MLSKLRDDVGGHLDMEPLGKPVALNRRSIGETTDFELTAMMWAVDTLLDRCREAIDDPALADYLGDLRVVLQREKAERVKERAKTRPETS